jgi:hypothetical protein
VKIVILVEGETERAFMATLRSFLAGRLAGHMPNLDPLKFDGRIPKEGRLRRIVEDALSGRHPADAVIALTDVYTGTNDFTDAADAKTKMTQWCGNNAKFFPHVALHDFEAWLLPFWDTIQRLAKHNKRPPAGAPERVDHGNPPAHRIQEIFRIGKCRNHYVKPRDAARILADNDLLASANACPELKLFLNRIIALSGGQPLP